MAGKALKSFRMLSFGKSKKEPPPPMQSMMQRQQSNMHRRSAVSAEVTSLQEVASFNPKVIPKSDNARRRIEAALEKNYLFKSLDKEQTKTVIDAVTEVKYHAGDAIIKQGDPGNQFYFLEAGTCEVWLKEGDKMDGKMVKEYGPGESFGELALLYNAPRAATILAKTDCTLWAVDRMTFRTILMNTTSDKRKLYERFLEDVPLLKTLDKYERSAISDVLEPEYYEPGCDIVIEGQPGEKFFILEEGEAEAKTSGKTLMKYKRGDYFGELALLNDKPRAATVTSITRCKCVSIDRGSFKRLLGKLEDILQRNKDEYKNINEGTSETSA